MLTDERKILILKVLAETGRVLAADLSQQLSVSEDTIRRDLRDLADQGLLRRVHGGALPAAVPRSPTSVRYSERADESPAGKASIARVASRLVRPGQTVVIDGGTTSLRVAHALPMELQLTVVTHSLPVAMELAPRPSVQVVFIGGPVAGDYLSTKGAATVAGYHQIRADLYFLGVASLHPTAGIGDLDAEDAEVKRAIIANAAEVVCVASSEKLGTSSPFIVAPVSAVHQLITDARASDELVEQYTRLGIRVTRAS